ncbi:RNA 2',3'-cyclic phosphodiesterase [Puniceicoccales bacterium CK1056]|uniref:RNA 2',3'-cyclic phosphodiesterase n=1 Tax=Oceanipulchritudo coccoides TaxID=2706888 RepID=A0A6B2M122_9BACT|nr:RNA 2',3'-cyclic phosphodiesterase [Oceanipulchritudo coccoides]NDV61747.1 RNA 2',3'-cyclic phosphodiesterase [Oceanipulchritudo coccoides]
MTDSSEPIHTFRGKRLFLSIDLPDYVKDSLLAIQEETLKGFNWVPRERFHLTLKFIGDIPGQFQETIEAAIDPIQVRSFLLPIDGLGSFPPMGKAHAVWAGLATGHPHLFQLHKRIEDALFNIGIEPEKRIYHPHITVARVNHAADESVRQFLKRHQNFGAAPFKVDAFHLMQSQEIEGKRVYSIERTWELTH